MATTKPRASQIRGLAKQQAPYLFNIIPDSYLPDSTGDVDVYGEFFTPDMTVSADGQTVNHFTFINSGHIKVNMTRGSAEGTFGLLLNNGIEAYFPNVLLIVLGEIFNPAPADWTNVSEPINFEGNDALVKQIHIKGSAEWIQEFDFTKDYRVTWDAPQSPLGVIGDTQDQNYNRTDDFVLKNISGTKIFGWGIKYESVGLWKIQTYSLANGGSLQSWYFNPQYGFPNYEFECIEGNMNFKVDGLVRRSFSDVISENLKLSVRVYKLDIKNIRYIELAT